MTHPLLNSGGSTLHSLREVLGMLRTPPNLGGVFGFEQDGGFQTV
jgi:hypothetical protein